MKRLLALVLATSFAASAAAAQAGKPAPPPSVADWSSWTEFHRDFANWPLDSTRVTRVESLLLERDAGTLVLQEGRLAFAAPLGGRVVAAVFVGRGTFSFVPRSDIERQQLRRFYGTSTLRVPVSQLVLFFSDSTARELADGRTFGPDTVRALQRAWKSAFPYLTWPRTSYVRPLELAQMLVDRDDDGLFRAMINPGRGGDPVFFTLDPTSTERVQLERRPDDDRVGMRRLYNAETVSQCFAAGDPDTLRRDWNPPYAARAYRTDVALDANPNLRATVEVDVVANGRERGWIAFDLPDWLHVDSLTCAGRRVRFTQEKDNTVVWTRVTPPIAAGETVTFRFAYHGEAFVRSDDWIWHRDMYRWFPRPAWAGEATWDMRFTHPSDLQVIAAGERREWRVTGHEARSRWIVERPMDLVSFDVNFLRGIHVTRDSLPVTVWTRRLDGAGKVTDATPAALRGARGDEAVAYDVANCLEFYARMFGEPVAKEFHALETPEETYVAYPGMIHMMLPGDRIAGRPDFSPHVIRAHEIAHQWFGLGLDNATYHDAWLSEGFADFCSLWYLQASRKDADNYFHVLDAWREKLLSNRKYVFGTGQEAGPIWLGTRTSSSTTPGDYNLVVYAKGAWVLHMLRNLLLDENDPSESAFRAVLREFYQRSRGRRVFTEEFRAVAEQVTGQDLGWFFAQWVYGTDVPACRFTWSTEPADGGWRVRGRIDTAGVPATFRFPVFVRVNFADGRYSRQRVWVEGPVTEFTLPTAPAKPSGVAFNDLHSVLCDDLK